MGSGRPRKPKADKQRHHVTATLTDGEYQALRGAAGEEAPGTYLRRLVLRHLARRGPSR